MSKSEGGSTPNAYNMLAKFETKSNRVKGLAFHPQRPWILAALHNGIVQLWDYRIGTLLDTFDEHDGPVRGIDFHRTQPLFASGGDDYKVKVWNYKLRRCVFTQLGHLDYIRTVQFHHEYPWIVSASDDQTIRITNWQSRSCVAVLTGHNHYVMCAQFHPKEDLLVSASLDQTARVWDIGMLRKKASKPGLASQVGASLNNEFFGGTDAIVKFVLEGHDRGVNWATFHHSLPLIATGADDRQVKLWRMGEAKAWEVDTLRGHVNNVSCVMFHPRSELLISNSEDRSIRVWDLSKRTGVQTFRREHDRFWILAAHPERNMLAAGHDSGLLVFKLERERPAACVYGDSLYYVKDRYLKMHSFSKGPKSDVTLMSLRRTAGAAPRSLSFNPAERVILVNSDAEGGSYELHKIPKDGSAEMGTGAGEGLEAKRGVGSHAVFVARNRFAVLDKFNQVLIKNLKNEVTKKLSVPFAVSSMFAAGTGKVLLSGDGRVTLMDIQQRKGIASILAPNVKFAIWSPDNEMVALISGHGIVVATKKLQHLYSVHETVRIKSGTWDKDGVFVYTTLNHIKYALRNGDTGIVRTLDVPVYLTNISGNTIQCLDREWKTRSIFVDTTEYRFKVALMNKNYDTVLSILKGSNKLNGQAIIAYLQEKGYPEVALYFVRDEKTRLNLALECGNIDVALEAAHVLNDTECWHRLGVEALRQGNHQVVEMAYQNTKNFERLAFLYLITGNQDKLRRMLKIAEMRSDTMGRFHNALFLGDVEERVRLLQQVGQHGLAYVTATTHGLSELAETIAAQLPPELLEALPPADASAELMLPPTPVLRLHDANWPLLTISRSMFEGAGDAAADARGTSAGLGMDDDDDGGDAGGWGDDDDLDLSGGAAAGTGDDFGAGDDDDDDGEGGWDDMEDLEGLPDIASVPKGGAAGGDAASEYFAPPTVGPSVAQRWTESSSLAGEHAAAGAFDTAMQLLRTQIGAKNMEPLKPFFMAAFSGSSPMLPSLPGLPPLAFAIHKDWEAGALQRAVRPAVAVTLTAFIDRLKLGYKAMTGGKFGDCLAHFVHIISGLPLVVVDSQQEANEAKELLGICREYITAVRLEQKRKEILKADPVRATELAALFTHCNLQPMHLMLALQSAMMNAYKIKNLATASSFCRRLLELNPKPETADKARRLLAVCDQNPVDEAKLNYDARNPFVICAASMTPIYKGSPNEKCAYCSAAFQPSYAGSTCTVCNIATVGAAGGGLTVKA